MSLHRIRGATCAALTLFAAACADALPTDAVATADDVVPSGSTMTSTYTTIYRNGHGMDVNNYGVVVGYAHEDGWDRALLWSPTAGLDTLPAFVAGEHNKAVAMAINDLGRIVGYALTPEYVFVPVLWSSSRSTPVNLGSLVPGQHSFAQDVNRAGMIVGDANVAPGVRRAWVLPPGGTMLDIDASGTGSNAMAVNDSGKVVGARKVSGRMRAYVWTQAGGFQAIPVGGDSSFAADINARGDVAGSYWVGRSQRAYVWSPRTGLTDLGAFGYMWGAATGINDAGTVVGEFVTDGGYRSAVTWNPRTGVRRIPEEAGGGRIVANAINRQGHVAGGRKGYDGWMYVTRWTLAEVNAAPTLSLPATLTAYEGDSITLNAGSTDADGDPLSYYWSFGDGANLSVPASTAPASVRRSWSDDGVFTLRVIATDPSGVRDTATSTVTILNRPPTATFTAPAYTYEGRTYVLTVSAVKDGPSDLRAGVQVAFDCGAGYSAWALTTRVTCPAKVDDDSVQIAVRLRDNDGAVTEYRRPFVIHDAQPVAQTAAVTTTSIRAGGSFTARGTFSDPGTADAPWLVRYFWGDGTYTSSSVTTQGSVPQQSHVYRTAGTYTVSMWITDKDGRTGRGTPVTVTVAP